LLKSRKRFDRERKIQAMKQVIDGEKTMGQIAKEFDVLPSVVSRWKSEYLSNPDSAFPGGVVKKIEQLEYSMLVKQLHDVTQERDILRKAIVLLYKREGPTGDI